MSTAASTAAPLVKAESSANGSGNQVTMSSQPSAQPPQSGPPYFCPSCQTSYSRLEYLRRHERRHQDIRPFVCQCGKGFSRSDVLSRHKRQCAVVLEAGQAGISVDTKPGKRGAKRKNATNGAATALAPAKRKQKAKPKRKEDYDQHDSLDSPDDDDDQPDRIGMGRILAPPPPPPAAAASLVGNSFPFPPQPGLSTSNASSAGVSSAAAVAGVSAGLLPPAPYSQEPAAISAPGSFSNFMPHHLTSFTLPGQQHHYPSSPESNGTLSQHGSPRFTSRDMSRHGSNGSRFSLRKGGSFDHIGPRATPSQYAQDFWDQLDPAAKPGNDYVSAVGTGTGTTPAGLSLADGPAAPGLNVVTTPRGGISEPHRFAVSTGPLSPFSSIALSSTMSPYLSAFSNARDTPFVASPSRGIIPGTPGASLNVFDWTMRPPSKPASSTMGKRDSISHVAGNSSSGTGMQASTSSQGQKKAKIEDETSATASSSASANKAKTEDDADRIKSPDEDQRSAAELLDSLRKSGASLGGTKKETSSSSTPAPAAPTASGNGESFFEQGNVTAGQEMFLNRRRNNDDECEGPKSQKQAQLRGGSVSSHGGDDISTTSSATNSAVQTPPLSMPLLSLGRLEASTMGESNSGNLSWMLSPSVQQLVNTFAAPKRGGEAVVGTQGEA